MNIFLSSLQAVGVLFGIGIVGFYILSRKIVPKSILEVLSPLVIDVGMPCLIFANIIQNFNTDTISDWWQYPLWWVFFTILLLSMTVIIQQFLKKKNRGDFGIALFYPNGVFVPIAVIAGLYGMNSPMLSRLFLFVIIYPAFFFNTYSYFFKNINKEERKLKNIFNPILISTIIALLISLTGLQKQVPELIIETCKLIGNISLPLIMIYLGGNIYVDFQNRQKIQIKELFVFLLLKNIIFPLIVLCILVLIKPESSVAFLILLLSAVPPITAIAIIGKKHKRNVALLNQFLVSSFIFSIITIPLFVYIFNLYFKIF